MGNCEQLNNKKNKKIICDTLCSCVPNSNMDVMCSPVHSDKKRRLRVLTLMV